jgi:RNA polymerase sigma-70 factor (ECF subfamily)
MSTADELPKPGTTESGNDLSFDSTIVVFEQAREGNLAARRELLIRTLDPLRRWARGLLPRFARAEANTDDIVQDVVVRALQALPRFEYSTAGAVLAYLRTSVRNRIADEIRKVSRRGVAQELVEVADDAISPLEELVLRERSERYIAALRSMRPNDRLLLILRLEQRLSFEEIARRLRKSTASSARIAFGRALKRLGQHLEIEFSSAVKR